MKLTGFADAATEVDRLLAESGAVLARKKKHEVWKLPNGNQFTRASTPSDIRAPLNQLTDLRRALGIVEPDRGKPGERRIPKPKTERQRRWKPEPTGAGVLADKLRSTGIIEASLRAEIEELKKPKCWWCRLTAWWLKRRWFDA
jgi:hypothetical protein